VTDAFPRKIAALRAHQSQIADADALEERLRGMLTSMAERGGLPAGRLAESFQVLQSG
jgi:LmbE family N-acetylglucosaminyl deacetylase